MEVIDGLMPTNIPFFKERADKIRAKSPLETASLNIVLQEAAVNAAAKATLVAKEAEEQAAAAHEYGSTPRAQLNFDNVNMTPADERTAGTPVVDIKKAEEEESQAKLMAARELAKAAIRAADAAKVVMDKEVEERARKVRMEGYLYFYSTATLDSIDAHATPCKLSCIIIRLAPPTILID